MGNVTYIAKSNSFWVKNLNEFKEGLKGFVGGEFNTPVNYHYEDYKKRSKKALVSVSSSDFDTDLYNEKTEKELDFLDYIRNYIVEGETCIIHLVSYEHPNDMSIDKYTITSESVEREIILED